MDNRNVADLIDPRAHHIVSDLWQRNGCPKGTTFYLYEGEGWRASGGGVEARVSAAEVEGLFYDGREDEINKLFIAAAEKVARAGCA